MANIKSYQFLRNQAPAASLDAAKALLQGHLATSLDGEVALARFYDEGGVVKTLMGSYYVNGSIKSVTFAEPTENVIDEVESYVEEQVESAVTAGITAISGTSSGQTNGAAGIIKIELSQTSGKVDSVVITNAYSANTSASVISAATSLQDADNKLDAAVKDLEDAIASGVTIEEGDGIEVTPVAGGKKVSVKVAAHTAADQLLYFNNSGELDFDGTLDAGFYD